MKSKSNFILLAILYVLHSVFYLARRTLSSIGPLLLKDTSVSINKESFGLLASSFGIMYGFGKILAGLSVDVFGPRRALTFGLVFSGLLILTFSISSSYYLLLLWWSLQGKEFTNFEKNWYERKKGVTQAYGWPPIAKMLGFLYTPENKGLIWAVLSTSQNVSSAFSPKIYAYLSE